MVIGAVILSAWAIVLVSMAALWLLAKAARALWGFTFRRDGCKLKQ